MREGRANGGVDGEGGAAAAAAAPVGALRRVRQPHSDPSSSGSAASSSSGRREAEEEGQGGRGKKQGRRKSKRREVVVRAIRERLPTAPSCWGNVSAVQGIGERSRRGERPGDVSRAGGAVEEDDSGAGTAAPAAAAAWCCVCPDGDCSLEPNPSANGKEDAGLRSFIESNDFYSDDCNPHAAADSSSVASPGARFD